MRTCISLGRTWLARSEVVIVGSLGKIRWVKDEEFYEVAYGWRWKGYSVFCQSRTIGEDVTSKFDI